MRSPPLPDGTLASIHLRCEVSILSVRVEYTERSARLRPRLPASLGGVLAVLAATALPLACSTPGQALLRRLAARAAIAFGRSSGAAALPAGRGRPALPAGSSAAQPAAGGLELPTSD